MASTTEEVVALRTKASAAVKLGKWHEDFAKVKKYANNNKVPMLAVWSNGDKCGHCVNFNKCILSSTFKKWQKTSGVAFWIGFGSDTYAPNQHGGEGYKFAKDGSLITFPFVRLYWKAGKVDVAKSGDDWDGGTGDGGATLVKNLKKYLKNYTPGESSSDEGEDTIPILTYKQNTDDSKYSLYVDGKVATKLSKSVAKKVVDRYNSCKD